MWEQVIIALLPLLQLSILAGWGLWMKRSCNFQTPTDFKWPFAENPGLALELADSITSVNDVLGEADTDVGAGNRKAGARLQHLDFGFIPLYVLFFAATALLCVGWTLGRIVIVLALLTALCDVVEDLQILCMLRGKSGVSAKSFGQAKWFFYFTTIAAEGGLFFVDRQTSYFKMAAGAVLVVAGVEEEPHLNPNTGTSEFTP